MKFIFTILLFVAVVIIMLLREFNPGMLTVYVLPSKSYEISKATFFLISMSIGAAIIFLLYFTRDLRRFLRGLRVQREQKKRLKVQELYMKGLNSMLAKRNSEAANYFQKGCDKRDAYSCTNLGYMYWRGLGVKKDLAKMIGLYTKGCSGGDPSGCHNLGVQSLSAGGIGPFPSSQSATLL